MHTLERYYELLSAGNIRTCGECKRQFNLEDKDDANEFYYGHDCEV